MKIAPSVLAADFLNLKSEMEIMREFIVNGKDLSENESIAKHKAWFESFKNNYTFTPENTEAILQKEIGRTFERVLEDSGVFKRTESGMNAFFRFIATIR